jgi:hypothetical protein
MQSEHLVARSRALVTLDHLRLLLAVDGMVPLLPEVAPRLIQLLNHHLVELIAEVDALKECEKPV